VSGTAYEARLFLRMSTYNIIDLFAGPGGLGEGFTSAHSGENLFRISVSVEMDEVAHRTLMLRAFFRQFRYAGKPVPDEYYQYLAGKMGRDKLESAYSKEWTAATKEALCAELGNQAPMHQPLIDSMIFDAVGKENDWLLIGGPPCQAYSLVGRSRMQNAVDYVKKRGHSFEEDHRHKLYRQYLRIIAMHGPSVFVMENVKGILSAKLEGERIFPKILADLRDPSVAASHYNWENVKKNKYRLVSFVTGKEPEQGKESEFLIRAEDYGIPQARHRVILLGIREDVFSKIDGNITPLAKSRKRFLNKVIGDLPPLRSGFSKGKDSVDRWKKHFQTMEMSTWIKDADPMVHEELVKAILELKKRDLDRSYDGSENFALNIFDGWYSDKGMKGLSNHDTRAHMDKDLARYLFVAAYGKAKGKSPHLKDFPEVLLPKHKNVDTSLPDQKFSDRFKVQVLDHPSSTVTSHISKDGHYFIHPDPAQCRSLTVREAARVQTFPDNYHFEGGRTQQYHQVGNAVPPYLAKQLANVVGAIFEEASMK